MWSNSRTSKILLALIFICIGVMQYTIFPLYLPLFLVMGGTLIADIFIPQRKLWTCLREVLYYELWLWRWSFLWFGCCSKASLNPCIPVMKTSG